MVDPNHGSVLLVLNARAGKGRAESPRQLLEDELVRRGRRYVIHVLDDESSFAELDSLVRKQFQQGTRRVIAAGGDGTASRVGQAMLHAEVSSEACLGIFPGGTANSLAQELGMPMDWTRAAEVVVSGRAVMGLDAMQIGVNYSFLRIGIGLDAETIGRTAPTAKRRFGRWAYFVSFLQRMRSPSRGRFKLIMDGKRRSCSAVQVFIANGGGITLAPFRLGPDIRVNDGIVNICAYDALTRFDYLKLLWRLLRGGYADEPLMKFWQARRFVKVSATPPQPVQADGEPMGTTPLRISIIPRAIQVIRGP